ncbi:DUF2922 domain-containing protein [Proteiniclasticum sp. QWL-01]|uniref:DUF2922 domain-containing protein n=1 Tax=Proteiniclasticum sp. QWL-01 TaxID=3036945 RepID=UPI0022090FC5|nr:DUF2922 domain-containing protein [Proteiniclasticum sp. QWL-01]UUM11922.1 DUF2922 domain-containing protein [Clostridiaceae bacterium HFYG-1003]WFF73422.1 DUF2922 domain-containing protein [Proteiniclasticum sp. QWL-01]
MNTLVCKFKNKAGKAVSLRVPNVKDGLTAEEVNGLMALIISSNIFFVGDQELASAVSNEFNTSTVLG